jgi:membrane-bound lytic murein transglycosylase D
MHDIQPVLEHPDYLSVANISLYDKISFNEISKITGVSVEIIKSLNPCYLRHVIPSSDSGSYLMLPSYAASTLLNHLYRPDMPSLDAYQVFQDNVLIGKNEKRLMRFSLEVPERLPMAQATPVVDEDLLPTIHFPIHRISRHEEDPVWYRMRKRESLFDIAKKKNISLSKLIELNGVSEDDLGPGRVIRLQ